MKIILILMSLSLLLPQLSFAIDLYVSPKGDDLNPGTTEKPLKTIIGARNVVRKINQEMTEDIVVHLRGGLYEVSTTINFESQDSGFNGHKVIYRSFKNETPILSGGIELKDWTLYNKEHNIYQTSVPKGFYRQLYINGKRAIRARNPNRESEKNFGPYLRLNATKNRELLIAAKDWNIIANVKHLNEIELVASSHWFHQRLFVGEYKNTSDGVVFTPLHPKRNMTQEFYFYNDSTYFFENSLSFVDQPTEWHYDLRESKIYLAVRSDLDINKLIITIPRIQNLIDVNGAPQNQINNLEFRGLTFEYTTWDFPSTEGLNLDQFAQPLLGRRWGRLSAAVSVKHVKYFAFRNNIFRNMGANAIFLLNADYSDIEGNEIYQISANGIVIDEEKPNPEAEMQSVGVAIWNNYIRKVGQDYTNGGGILANNIRGLILEHNELQDMPYSGVQICNQPRGLRDIGCGDNRICYNYIHNVMQLHDDGGGIYTLGGVQNGSVIAENFLHDISPGQWAGTYSISMIYLDNFSSNIMVRDNVIRNGKAEQRNGSVGNYFVRNVQSSDDVESKAGIKNGYNPRVSSCLRNLTEKPLSP